MMDSGLNEILRILAALGFVLALMGGLVLVLRKLGYATQYKGKDRRLKLVEVLHIDGRRKMAIIQRDEKQHLVLLGQNSETVIESGIESGQDNANVT